MQAEFHTLIEDERGTLRLEFNHGRVFVHTVFIKPVAAMRKAKEVWPEVKRIVRNLGYRFVHVLIPVGDAMLERFEKSFGFAEVLRTKHCIVMRQEV